MPDLLDINPIDYRHIATYVHPAVVVASLSPANPGPATAAPSLNLNRNVPTMVKPRYHTAVFFPKQKSHEAHFPVPGDELGRVGLAQRGGFHHRAGFRRALGPGELERPAGFCRGFWLWGR